jgi:prepilin-type N-terminal cleavage/methylation domain-containing protein
MKPRGNGHRNRKGFTLLEVAIAVVILTGGVLALVGTLTWALASLNTSQEDFLAQAKAAEAVESVFTARDTRVLNWGQIRNVLGSSGSDGGVFRDGPQPLLDPGLDGLVNTADDNANLPDSIWQPGPDGILGTSDDVRVPLSNYTREIQIRDVSPNLRSIQVIMRYQVGRLQRSYTLTTYISSFS